MLCPSCMSAVTPLAKLITGGAVGGSVLLVIIGGLFFIAYGRQHNFAWFRVLIRFGDGLAMLISSVVLILVGLLLSYVVYQVIFPFLVPIGAKYHEKPWWKSE